MDLEDAAAVALGGDDELDLEDAAVVALGGPAAARAPVARVRAARVRGAGGPRGRFGFFLHRARMTRAKEELKKVRKLAPFSKESGSTLSDKKAVDWIKSAYGSMDMSLHSSSAVASKVLASRASTVRATTVIADSLVTGQNKRVEQDSACAHAWSRVRVCVFVFSRARAKKNEQSEPLM